MERVEKRSIVTLILLSFITCGIYNLYLIYKQSQEINLLADVNESAGTELMLSLITCGLYIFYWHYKYAKRVALLQENKGITVNDVSVLNLIISILGLEFIAAAILQNEMNNVIEASSNTSSMYY